MFPITEKHVSHIDMLPITKPPIEYSSYTVFAPVPRISHPWPKNTYGIVRARRARSFLATYIFLPLAIRFFVIKTYHFLSLANMHET